MSNQIVGHLLSMNDSLTAVYKKTASPFRITPRPSPSPPRITRALYPGTVLRTINTPSLDMLKTTALCGKSNKYSRPFPHPHPQTAQSDIGDTDRREVADDHDSRVTCSRVQKNHTEAAGSKALS